MQMIKLTRPTWLCALALAALSFPAAAGDQHCQSTPAAPTNAGFEKLKTLVGTWVAADQDGKPTGEVVSIIRLTAGGSAIHETLFPGQPHEMISLYTAEGADLVMTHYCMLGNQPRLKASTQGLENKLHFEFAGGANLDPKKDKHMHSGTLTIVDADHIEIAGVAWENGAPSPEICSEMKLVRKK
jgi:hypothetical protein